MTREIKSIVTVKSSKAPKTPSTSSTGKGKGPGSRQTKKSKTAVSRDIYEGQDDDILDADTWRDEDPIDEFPAIKEIAGPGSPKRNRHSPFCQAA